MGTNGCFIAFEEGHPTRVGLGRTPEEAIRALDDAVRQGSASRKKVVTGFQFHLLLRKKGWSHRQESGRRIYRNGERVLEIAGDLHMELDDGAIDHLLTQSNLTEDDLNDF